MSTSLDAILFSLLVFVRLVFFSFQIRLKSYVSSKIDSTGKVESGATGFISWWNAVVIWSEFEWDLESVQAISKGETWVAGKFEKFTSIRVDNQTSWASNENARISKYHHVIECGSSDRNRAFRSGVCPERAFEDGVAAVVWGTPIRRLRNGDDIDGS
jgi:hypothetical protein